MKLIPAPGSQEMQNALRSPLVLKIVEILLQINGQDIFRLVGRFLKDYDRPDSPKITTKLNALRYSYLRRPNAKGHFVVPSVIDELLSTLKALYEQNQVLIDYQRGAIVELLTSKLVESRCEIDECKNNHRFVDGRYSSDQVDVPVLSESRQQIEGYTCKVKPKVLASVDCTNLTALADKAIELGYQAYIGVVCFDNSSAIKDRIRFLFEYNPPNMPIKVFGLDNIDDLGKSPFGEDKIEEKIASIFSLDTDPLLTTLHIYTLSLVQSTFFLQHPAQTLRKLPH